MQAKTIIWDGMCIAVVLRPGNSDKQEQELEIAVKDAAQECEAPETLYKWMPVTPLEGEAFSAWNIGHPGLFLELLRNRAKGLVDFDAYYRFCGGVSIVLPEGDFFRDF